MTTNHMLEWLATQTGQTYCNFINGQWIQSESKKTYPIYNPGKKEQLLGYFQSSNQEDVDRAVRAAHEAFKKWSKVPGPDRGLILMRFAELLEQNIDELAFMLSAEQGKALSESRGEIVRATKETRFAAGEALRIEGKTMSSERANVFNSTLHRPIGVIAAIAPWNFPVVTPVRKIVPALAYGCTVIYKPASETPWTSVRLMQLLTEAGVPKGAVNLVTGKGSQLGDPLIKHPLVKGISFTGSTEIGIGINEIAAKRLARTQLELGGKNPAVVLDYERPQDVAKEIVSAAFTCSGQRCTAISRVIVIKDRAEELIQEIVKQMRTIKIGPAWDETANMGPIATQGQLESIQEYVQVGKSEGASLVYGGEILDEGEFKNGYYMAPALFTNVTPEMRIAREEIFGPVLSIIAVDNKEEAFEVANAVDYGLAASIFTNNLSSVYQFVEQMESGMVHINHGTASQAHVPFGGVKQSGFGSFSIGSTNKDFFTEMKVIYLQY